MMTEQEILNEYIRLYQQDLECLEKQADGKDPKPMTPGQREGLLKTIHAIGERLEEKSRLEDDPLKRLEELSDQELEQELSAALLALGWDPRGGRAEPA